MSEIYEMLLRHGIAILFLVVFIDRIGIPLPSAPWLLVAGALVVAGKINWLTALLATALGALLADMIWFYFGRHYGTRVMSLLCRIAFEPDSCARRTQDFFTRYGARGLVVSKFVPGLSILAPPLAGNAGVSTPRFLFFDGLSSLVHGGCFILLGVLFSRQLQQIVHALVDMGRGAIGVIAGLAALYIGYKYFQRCRLLRKLRVARITVDELHQKQESGENPVLLDLRPDFELKQDPTMIRGAIHMTMDEVERRHQEIPRDCDIILYCSCPNEVSSAKVALELHRKGIMRVRPLLGGIDAWRKRNYPTEPWGVDGVGPINSMGEGAK